jgi:hypothetical protein
MPFSDVPFVPEAFPWNFPKTPRCGYILVLIVWKIGQYQLMRFTLSLTGLVDVFLRLTIKTFDSSVFEKSLTSEHFCSYIFLIFFFLTLFVVVQGVQGIINAMIDASLMGLNQTSVSR